MPIPKDISEYVDKDNPEGCWIWTGAGDRYGRVTFMQIGMKAHRFIYHLLVGEIPDGYNVLHKCDNTKCVNPLHLFLGSQKDNIHDMMRKGRARMGSKKGSKHKKPRCIKLYT